MLRRLIVLLLCKPFARIILGLSVVHRDRLVKDGPAIVVANHNSHLDTLILFSLFPSRLVPKIRPVAAADYFMSNPVSRFLSTRIIGILPVDRQRADRSIDPLLSSYVALERGDILLLFPEGTRGEPERMSALKTGVARLAQKFPHVAVQPVFLRGAGRSLPKGGSYLVPFLCHAIVGEPLTWSGDKDGFMRQLGETLGALEREAPPLYWE